ncbi:hypothetical protein SmJEL517_g01527 [Synchytrium microbalum]|uniref:peptidyl-tRNA hydrolase n=1 Tax=Synchytrium microbalum TaxID=1806994 RepID=A0A507CFJ4_9FUNG|nr:uncharacterized protein SmJEL517_g01527 [Synchytrium microbalum]TPX36355.1 hypothetical protein SmJEL517_g01527 [Synchytrium microbalum]
MDTASQKRIIGRTLLPTHNASPWQLATSLLIGVAIGRLLPILNEAFHRHFASRPPIAKITSPTTTTLKSSIPDVTIPDSMNVASSALPPGLVVPILSTPEETRPLVPAKEHIESSSDESSDSLDEYYKMVFVVRKDLNMTSGKVIAQCCHAAIELYSIAMKTKPEVVEKWLETGATKIALKATNEKELLKLYQQAQSKGLVSCVIEDAGHTQVAEGSRTVLGIGPALIEEVDSVTKNLKLY